ncbi:geranylgeranylglyceryl/heptaprenylglyceryl phosphate synthase [Flavobacteriales bacterium 34_180_T64]|nr:geranylgeranylglyceryl/heptaprenylglyceryl phosphate synthase [Flavobacteriales bacterium 34_180_T64]
MKQLYQDILDSAQKGKKLLAILVDPDKMMPEGISSFFQSVNNSIITHIFVGGSTVNDEATEALVLEIKKQTQLPIVLFPGDVTQITEKADALLFLSLISGKNPEYLIGKQVEAVSKLRTSQLEIIPTGYILIENGKKTSVQKVTQTQPMVRSNIQHIVNTAKAGELLGMKLIYLEAGSGATHSIPDEIVSAVKQDLQVPLIVGGGIKSKKQLEMTFNAGADVVVIGTAFEEDASFFDQIK